MICEELVNIEPPAQPLQGFLRVRSFNTDTGEARTSLLSGSSKTRFHIIEKDTGKLLRYKDKTCHKASSEEIQLWNCEISLYDKNPSKDIKIITDSITFILSTKSKDQCQKWLESLVAWQDYFKSALEAAKGKLPDHLTPSEILQVVEFERLLRSSEVFKEAPQVLKNRFNTTALINYLNAVSSHWNVEKSLAFTERAIKLRIEKGVHEIDESSIPESFKEKNYLFDGYSKDSQPIIRTIIDGKIENFDEFASYYFWLMEKAIDEMPEGVSQWIWIVDLKNYSSKCNPTLSETKEAIDLFYSFYPNVLGQLFVIDPPSAFNMFWKAAKQFLDSATTQKIKFATGSKQEKLSGVIDEELLSKHTPYFDE